MALLNASQSASANHSASNSWANSAGNQASAISQLAAANANSSALSSWREAAQYNAQQAEIQRAWQERMANTVYQRTVEDMKKAGINPILAAQMGLGTASVGSGAQASMGNPQTFMPNTFAEYNSASTAESNGWSNSTSGLMTAISQIAEGLGKAFSGLSSGVKVDIDLGKFSNAVETFSNLATDAIKDKKQGLVDQIKNKISNSRKSYEEKMKKYNSNGNGGSIW